MLRAARFALLPCLAGSLVAGNAAAECDVDFDVAATKTAKLSMVRAFGPCPGTEGFWTINTETEGEVPACTPVQPSQDATDYSFGVDGGCLLNFKSVYYADCATLESSGGAPLGFPVGPCHVTKVLGYCKNVLRTDDLTLITADDTGWTLRMIARFSIDYEPGAMTVVDYPMIFAFGEPSDGKIEVRGTSAEAMLSGDLLPPCTSMEIVRIEVLDPDGRPFARPGMATVPE